MFRTIVLVIAPPALLARGLPGDIKIDNIEQDITGFNHIPIDGAIDLGCWTDRKNDRIMTLMTTSKSMTHEYCRDWCAEQQTEDFVPKFFGVEFGRECFCGDETTDYQKHGYQDVVCNETVDCTGDSEHSNFCGGYDGIDMWEFKEDAERYTYAGCWNDKKSGRVVGSAYEASTSDMTVQACADICLYTRPEGYFALQFGRECWCAGPEIKDDFGRHGEASCGMQCVGEPHDDFPTCGDRNRFDLFHWI